MRHWEIQTCQARWSSLDQGHLKMAFEWISLVSRSTRLSGRSTVFKRPYLSPRVNGRSLPMTPSLVVYQMTVGQLESRLVRKRLTWIAKNSACRLTHPMTILSWTHWVLALKPKSSPQKRWYHNTTQPRKLKKSITTLMVKCATVARKCSTSKSNWERRTGNAERQSSSKEASLHPKTNKHCPISKNKSQVKYSKRSSKTLSEGWVSLLTQLQLTRSALA